VIEKVRASKDLFDIKNKVRDVFRQFCLGIFTFAFKSYLRLPLVAPTKTTELGRIKFKGIRL
jgi:hypothetical protein